MLIYEHLFLNLSLTKSTKVAICYFVVSENTDINGLICEHWWTRDLLGGGGRMQTGLVILGFKFLEKL